MTYLAPRQGLFAIILTISFILHTLLLVFSNQHQLSQINQQTGERIVEQLISESTLALSSKDTVSLSVLAQRYTSDFDIASLVIKDADNSVLVSLGGNPLAQGTQIVGVAALEDTLLGEVTLSLEPINTGRIVSSLWPFILGALLIHFFIWLLYGYVSRPTKEQLAMLSQEVRERLLAQQPRMARARRGASSKQYDDEDIDYNSRSYNSRSNGNNENIDNTLTNTPSVTSMLKGKMTQSVTQQSGQQGSVANSQKPVSPSTKAPLHLIANRSMRLVTIQIHFVDKDNLLSTLAPEKSAPYFALCTQLLEQTVADLLKLPLLNGVSCHKLKGFGEKFDLNLNIDTVSQVVSDRASGVSSNVASTASDKDSTTGATVQLYAQDPQAKVALAGVMLGELYVMLNRIVYTKHRELQRFALNVKVGVSDEIMMTPMQQLMAYHATADEVLVLLPKAGMMQLSNHIQLQNLKRPTTVYERECALVVGTDDAMMKRLVDVRNDVLLAGQ